MHVGTDGVIHQQPRVHRTDLCPGTEVSKGVAQRMSGCDQDDNSSPLQRDRSGCPRLGIPKDDTAPHRADEFDPERGGGIVFSGYHGIGYCGFGLTTPRIVAAESNAAFRKAGLPLVTAEGVFLYARRSIHNGSAENLPRKLGGSGVDAPHLKSPERSSQTSSPSVSAIRNRSIPPPARPTKVATSLSTHFEIGRLV